jgi:L-aspartate oxidase
MTPPALPRGAPVILGAGLAGLVTALAAAPRPVILVSPVPPPEGGASRWAQGGIAAATGPGDSVARHLADTLAVGGGLNDPDAARRLIALGPAVIERLEAWGVRFARTAGGAFAYGQEAGHSLPRIHHSADRTGAAVMAALTARLATAAHVTPLFGVRARALHVAEGRVGGIWLARAEGAAFFLPAPAVVLATGGAAGLFGARCVPAEADGSALALAARAGARLRDPEFVQFHPTALDVPTRPLPLLTEALRGAGAVVVDGRGEAFADPLAPRDRLARAIARRRSEGEPVFLDARPIGAARLARSFPGFLRTLAAHGFDPAHPVVPVRPAAHYHMGGVCTDAAGASDLPGLFAVGEAAASGLHGANRLASNALLEAAAMGLLLGGRLRDEALPPPPPPPAAPPPAALAPPPDLSADACAALLDAAMGLWRSGPELARALGRLRPAIASSDRALAAFLMTAAAWARRESRGAHARADHPDPAPEARSTFLTLAAAEALAEGATAPSGEATASSGEATAPSEEATASTGEATASTEGTALAEAALAPAPFAGDPSR